MVYSEQENVHKIRNSAQMSEIDKRNGLPFLHFGIFEVTETLMNEKYVGIYNRFADDSSLNKRTLGILTLYEMIFSIFVNIVLFNII